MKFQGVPVQKDDRRETNVRNRVAAAQRSRQGLRSFAETAGVENEVVYRDVASAQQGPLRLIPPPKTPGR